MGASVVRDIAAIPDVTHVPCLEQAGCMPDYTQGCEAWRIAIEECYPSSSTQTCAEGELESLWKSLTEPFPTFAPNLGPDDGTYSGACVYLGKVNEIALAEPGYDIAEYACAHYLAKFVLGIWGEDTFSTSAGDCKDVVDGVNAMCQDDHLRGDEQQGRDEILMIKSLVPLSMNDNTEFNSAVMSYMGQCAQTPETCKEHFDSAGIGIFGMGPCAGSTENWCPASCRAYYDSMLTTCKEGDVYAEEDVQDADGNPVLDENGEQLKTDKYFDPTTSPKEFTLIVGPACGFEPPSSCEHAAGALTIGMMFNGGYCTRTSPFESENPGRCTESCYNYINGFDWASCAGTPNDSGEPMSVEEALFLPLILGGAIGCSDSCYNDVTDCPDPGTCSASEACPFGRECTEPDLFTGEEDMQRRLKKSASLKAASSLKGTSLTTEQIELLKKHLPAPYLALLEDNEDNSKLRSAEKRNPRNAQVPFWNIGELKKVAKGGTRRSKRKLFGELEGKVEDITEVHTAPCIY